MEVQKFMHRRGKYAVQAVMFLSTLYQTLVGWLHQTLAPVVHRKHIMLLSISCLPGLQYKAVSHTVYAYDLRGYFAENIGRWHLNEGWRQVVPNVISPRHSIASLAAGLIVSNITRPALIMRHRHVSAAQNA